MTLKLETAGGLPGSAGAIQLGPLDAAQRTNSSVIFCYCDPTLGSWRGLSLTQLLLRLMGEEVDLTSLRGAWLSLTSQMGDTGD